MYMQVMVGYEYGWRYYVLTCFQFLSLQGSYSKDGGTLMKMNEEIWHIPELIPPVPLLEEQDGETIIEVDPAYM
jgi:hypothetical protein